MSYKAAAKMKPILCVLELSSDQALSSGDPIGWSVQDGTSGHGVTVSNGVITLPSAHKWFAQSQVVLTSVTACSFDWYVDNSASTTFDSTGIEILTSGGATSNVVAHAYVDAADSSTDLELRSQTNSITAEADHCFLILIGYPT